MRPACTGSSAGSAATTHGRPGRGPSGSAPAGRTAPSRSRRLAQVLIEDKGASVAVHWRLASRDGCGPGRDAGHGAPPRRWAAHYRLQLGKAVGEIVPAQATKAHAIRAFMEQAPYAGRRAVFLGDDRTDEIAFAIGQARMAASAMRVGDGRDGGGRRLPDPAGRPGAAARLGRGGAHRSRCAAGGMSRTLSQASTPDMNSLPAWKGRRRQLCCGLARRAVRGGSQCRTDSCAVGRGSSSGWRGPSSWRLPRGPMAGSGNPGGSSLALLFVPGPEHGRLRGRSQGGRRALQRRSYALIQPLIGLCVAVLLGKVVLAGIGPDLARPYRPRSQGRIRTQIRERIRRHASWRHRPTTGEDERDVLDAAGAEGALARAGSRVG